MHRSTLAALALTSTVGATLQKRQLGGEINENAAYLHSVCAPANSTNQLDLTFPCNQYTLVQYQCIYGSDINFTALQDPTRIDDNAYIPSEQAPSAQRNCACQSQLYSLLNACLDCYTAHGGSSIDALGVGVGDDTLASASSSYCAASATPTDGLAIALYNIVLDNQPATTDSAETSSFTDPIGNSTAVSYYYTPSVTGSAAYVLAQPTGPNGNVTYSSLNTVSGQIRPTAAGSQEGGSQGGDQSGDGSDGDDSNIGDATSGSEESSSATDSGAIETAAVKYGSAGLLGFAAAVAML